MKKLLAIVSVAMLATPSFSSQNETLNDVLDVSATINIDNYYAQSSSGDYEDNAQIKGSAIKFTAKISENIRAVLLLKLDRTLRANGVDISSQMNLEEFVKHAYIDIRNVGGSPVAVLIGKQSIPMGVGFDRMLNVHANRVRGLRTIDEVFGLTVTLDNETIGKIEASVFEDTDGAGDLDIGEMNSYTIRYSRVVADGVEVRGSYSRLGHEDRDDETRAVVGAVYKVEKNTFWAEGVYFTNHAKFGDGHAANVGYSREFKYGEAVASVSFIQDSLVQVAAGLNLKVSDSVSVGPEVRYNMYEDSDLEDDYEYGVRTQIRLRKK